MFLSICLLCLVVLVSINVYSIQLSARIQIIFTVSKLLALAIIVVGGIVKLFEGNSTNC
jgi:L-type amino acid transporter 9